MSSPFVSIIIPMYNAELYIKKTICSVINQTYKDFELLIIDDGSTDSSLIICKDLALKDKRIIVLSKSNGGVSSARNYGIKNAKGEWILFVDSDDLINKDYIISFISQLNNEKLIMQLGCNVIHSNNKNEILSVGKSLCFTNSEKQKFVDLYKIKLLYSAVWGKIFNSRIIKHNHIEFNEGIQNGEDRLFVSNYLLCPEITGFSFVNSIGYNYFLREGSITHSDIKIISYCLSNTYHLKQLILLIEKFGLDNYFIYSAMSETKNKIYDGLLLFARNHPFKKNHYTYTDIKDSLNLLKPYKTNKKLDLLFKVFPFRLGVYILKLLA